MPFSSFAFGTYCQAVLGLRDLSPSDQKEVLLFECVLGHSGP